MNGVNVCGRSPQTLTPEKQKKLFLEAVQKTDITSRHPYKRFIVPAVKPAGTIN
jgi:hypothetical protein